MIWNNLPTELGHPDICAEARNIVRHFTSIFSLSSSTLVYTCHDLRSTSTDVPVVGRHSLARRSMRSQYSSDETHHRLADVVLYITCCMADRASPMTLSARPAFPSCPLPASHHQLYGSGTQPGFE